MQKNDGSGWEIVAAAHSPFSLRERNDGHDFLDLTHPVPVISRRAFAQKRRVVDSIIDWCNTARAGTAINDLNMCLVWGGDYYFPGTVVEDGLRMACIWEE